MKYPISDHYDGKHFHNEDRNTDVNKGFTDILKWKLKERAKVWPEMVYDNVKPNFTKTLGPREAAVTFINHASDFIQTHDVNVITDPVFSERVSPLTWAGPKRHRNPGATIEELPKLDVILISHNHYDHLDLAALKKLVKKENPKIIVPLGNKEFLEKNGVTNVTELDWWQNCAFGSSIFTLVPMQHWSSRSPLDRCETLWGGFVIKSSEIKFLFSGDSGYGPQFKEISNRFGPMDVSLLPIGAYEPRWFMKDHHMNPSDAVKAHLDLKSELSIALHFGTFQLTDEGIEDPVTELDSALREAKVDPSQFIAPKNGQTIFYKKSEPSGPHRTHRD